VDMDQYVRKSFVDIARSPPFLEWGQWRGWNGTKQQRPYDGSVKIVGILFNLKREGGIKMSKLISAKSGSKGRGGRSR